MNEMMNEYLHKELVKAANEMTLNEILSLNESGTEFVVEDGAITDVLHK